LGTWHCPVAEPAPEMGAREKTKFNRAKHARPPELSEAVETLRVSPGVAMSPTFRQEVVFVLPPLVPQPQGQHDNETLDPGELH
jgi:hypothetical protein